MLEKRLSIAHPVSQRVLTLLLVALFLSSCAWFKKAPKDDKVYDEKENLDQIQGHQVFNPETGEYEKVKAVTAKMDTLRWVEADPRVYPPIKSSSKPGIPGSNQGNTSPAGPVNTGESIKKDIYNIAIVLPFLTHIFDYSTESINESSQWALHFYGGAKIALDRLNQEGVGIKASVLDSKADPNTVKDLLSKNMDLRKADLIIGPYRRDNIMLVAEFAKEKNISFVSPYSASSNLSTNNPNYLQVNPTFETHCTAITRHVLRSFQPGQVVLVAKNTQRESDRFRFFQDAKVQVLGTRDSANFKELEIPENFSDFTEEKLRPLIKEGKRTAFIVPSWSNETFVSNFLRILDLARGNNEVVVYGMPQWMDFEKIDYDYFERLKVHVSSATFVNPTQSEVRFFRKAFFDNYHTIPREEAFLGYDVMLYFGRQLARHGTKFQKWLELEKETGLGRNFEFEPISAPGGSSESPAAIDQYENKAVYILKYENYLFKQNP